MKGTIHDLKISGHECTVYLPQEYYMSGMYFPVVYMNGGDNIPEIIGDIEPHFNGDCNFFMLVSVQSNNWNADYTPWTAAALSEKSDKFGGCADSYLFSLTNNIKPFIDANYRTNPEPENTALVGYSLGGLAALYALYKSTFFGKIGSLSGSLWYDGWIEFMERNIPLNTASKIYLSLGKGEERSRNQRMSKVGSCTRKAAEILVQQLEFRENLLLEWNNGGHFTEVPRRFQRALLWLMGTDS